jgi:general secretion pathway protein D
MVRITAEVRTNSVIVSATEDNMKIIEDLINRLDDKSASAIKLKLYALRFADATSVAKLVNDLFAETPTNSSQQNRLGGGGRGGMLPIWMGGGGPGGAQPEPQGATKEVRAVADLRTNSVLVAASEQRLVLIDAVMTEIDRQVSDLLEVKIYKLQNADATQMATVLQTLFQPQIKATQSVGQTSGNAQNGQRGFGGPGVTMAGRGNGTGVSTGSGLLPSQEIEIAADTRTRSVIAKASREYIAIIDEVVKKLDQDPTETVSTFVIPLRNADAANVSLTLQNLLRSSQTGAGANTPTTIPTRQNQGPFSGMQTGSNNPFGNGGSSSFGSGSSSRSSFGSTSRFGNLGPLEGSQESPAPAAPQDEGELRRSIEGQADIQADTTTNSLVIRTSPRNFQSIQGVLRDLDRMRPQVLIKVLIADVTLDEQTQFGVEGFWEHKFTPSGSAQTTSKYSTNFPLSTSGLTYTLTPDNGKYQLTLNAFASVGKLRVLATPRILVLDNQTANINVGKQVPRITNTTINSLGNPINTIAYENIGIILNVTPHINPDGLVTMIVAPEISDLASAAESVEITPGVTSPTFNVNSALTSVAVRNGTTVVIGGMIRNSLDDSVSKIPILGDIPLIGALFSNTSKHTIKRELMIFLTPYVAYTGVELEEITQLEKSRLKIMEPADIDAESDRWLERIRK